MSVCELVDAQHNVKDNDYDLYHFVARSLFQILPQETTTSYVCFKWPLNWFDSFFVCLILDFHSFYVTHDKVTIANWNGHTDCFSYDIFVFIEIWILIQLDFWR